MAMRVIVWMGWVGAIVVGRVAQKGCGCGLRVAGCVAGLKSACRGKNEFRLQIAFLHPRSRPVPTLFGLREDALCVADNSLLVW